MLTTLLQVLHVFVCAILMFVVLLQQGKGGGLGAVGGGGATQVFGGRGAGTVLTRTTAIAAATFMLTSVSLAYISSSGDRALRARATSEEQKHSAKTTKAKDDKAAAPAAPAAGSAATPAPAPAPTPAPASSP
jgi:preprotein translocase subunit SecG